MGGGGHIAAMNAAIKRNERKRDKRSYFRQKPTYTSKEVKKIYSRELSRKERNLLRKRSHYEKKKNELLNAVLLIISLALTGIVVYLMLTLLMTYFF
jgi:hypothetical protein